MNGLAKLVIILKHVLFYSCSEQVKGKFLRDLNDPSSRCRQVNGQLEIGCQFKPDLAQNATTSIMGYFDLTSVCSLDLIFIIHSN